MIGLRAAVMGMAFCLLAACSDGYGEAMEHAVRTELPEGSHASEVEAFFVRHDLDYFYDERSNRYSALSGKPGDFRRVRIFINMDAKGRVMSSAVHEMLNLP